MTTPVKPRQLVHRGVVDTAGVFFPSRSLAEDEARSRVLATLDAQTRVVRTDEGLVALRSRRIDTRVAPGTVLVAVGAAEAHALAAAPLDADELEALAPPRGALVLVLDGEARVTTLERGEDPASWLDVTLELDEVVPLGTPPPPPALAVAPPRDVRQAFGAVAKPPPPEHAEVVRALAAAAAAVAAQAANEARAAGAAREAKAAGQSGSGAAGAPTGAALFLLGMLAALAAVLARLFAPAVGDARAARDARATSSGRPPAASGSGRRELQARPAAPSGPSLLDKLRAQLADALAKLLLRTRLARLVGERQAKYMREMVDCFERGDLDEALRRAIPLAKDGDGGATPAFGVPTPRDAITIRAEEARGASSLLVGGDLFGDLRGMYRRAFEKLDERGDVEKAAFVLAELLHENQEAVAYLERHERWQLAAEIAEARGLPPAMVVRQWFLAKNRERAMAIARREGVFADAVARLSASHPEEAEALRLLWADALATAGDLGAAITVAESCARAAELVRAWVELAVEGGGTLGARMLARRLSRAPASFDDTRDRILALLAEDGPAGLDERATLLRALLSEPSSPAVRLLARPAARAALRDRGRGLPILTAQELSSLLDRAGGELSADAPSPGTLPPLSSSLAGPWTLWISDVDTGARAMWDAAALPSGRLLIALGEAGVELLGPGGRVLHRFEQPATELVVSMHGDRALAVVPRGDATRIARVDVARRRAEPWTEARLVAHARRFDGASWLVALPGAGPAGSARLALLDCLEPRLVALAQLPVTGTVRALFADAMPPGSAPSPPAPGARLVSGELDALELRELGLAPLRLARSAQLATEGTWGPRVAVALRADEGVDTSPGWVVTWGPVPAGDAGPGRSPSVQVTAYARDGQTSPTALPRLVLTLAGATRVRARLTDDTVVVADDRGRVLVLDLALGAVLRSLRT